MEYLAKETVFIALSAIFSSNLWAEDEILTGDELPGSEQALQIQSLYDSRASVDQLDSKQGAYGYELSEALIDLGRAYYSLGRQEDALQAFTRALHVYRVNEGLYDLGQVKIVEMIIESNTAKRDWEALSQNYDYLYWVYRRGYGQSDPRLLPLIDRIGQWRLNAYYYGNNGLAVEHLIKADDLYAKAMQMIHSGVSMDDKERVKFLSYIAVFNYHIADNVRDKFKMSIRDIRKVMIANERPTPYVNEIAVRDFYYWQSVFKGERAIDDIVELHAAKLPASAVEYARALIFLGDYYLALKKRWEAMGSYKRAYQALVDNHVNNERINELFGEPKPLKTLSYSEEGAFEIATGTAYVDAVLDVSGSGWPSNIKITNIHPQDSSDLFDRGKMAITGIPYRPRFKAGKPVDAMDVKLRYYFVK